MIPFCVGESRCLNPKPDHTGPSTIIHAGGVWELSEETEGHCWGVHMIDSLNSLKRLNSGLYRGVLWRSIIWAIQGDTGILGV